jgi:hypothetical protein
MGATSTEPPKPQALTLEEELTELALALGGVVGGHQSD